jgi:hypothetical protein
VRVTLLSRMTQGLPAKLAARTARQKERVKATTPVLLQEEFSIAQSLINRDTEFSANNMIAEVTREGYNYALGFRRDQFVGKTNPVTGKVVTEFYIRYVHDGTRYYAGNPFLATARRLMRPRIRAAYARALSGR